MMKSDDLPGLDWLQEALAARPLQRLPFSDAAYEAHLIEDTPGEPVENAAEIEKILVLETDIRSPWPTPPSGQVETSDP